MTVNEVMSHHNISTKSQSVEQGGGGSGVKLDFWDDFVVDLCIERDLVRDIYGEQGGKGMMAVLF